MSVTYGFYDSLNGDRKYTAVQLSRIFEGVLTNGIFSTVGSALVVSANSGMTVTVGTGRAWFDFTWTLNDSPLVLTVEPSEAVLNRIDTVILEVNSALATRANSIKILKGTPSSSPVPPTLSNSTTLKQYGLANISVTAGVTAIFGANITNLVGTTNTPFISGLLTSIDASILLGQFQSQFDTWFANLVSQLTTNQATNLQAQIDTLNAQATGWISNSNSWTYLSSDAAYGTVNVNADLTTKIQKGYRLKYSQVQALTAYWDLNANSNSQVGSFNGTETAVTYSAGKFGNAAGFNGSTSKSVFADHASLKPTGDFTIGVRVKTSGSGANQRIFQSFSANSAIAGFHITVDAAGKFFVVVGRNSGAVLGADYSSFISTTSVNDGNWHNVVFTLRNNYGQIYVDGVLEASGFCHTPVYAATNYVRLGCGNTTGSDSVFFNGQIDDLYLINGYALDEQYIKSKHRENTAQGSSSITLTKYGIVHEVGTYSGGNTPISFWGGNDYSLANSTISNVCYSSGKAPFGFDPSPDKWAMVYTSVVLSLIPNAPLNQWNAFLAVPWSVQPGRWRVILRGLMGIGRSVSGVCDCNVSLANDTDVYGATVIPELRSSFYYSPVTEVQTPFNAYYPSYTVSVKKSLYVTMASINAGIVNQYLRSDTSPLIVRCEDAYL